MATIKTKGPTLILTKLDGSIVKVSCSCCPTSYGLLASATSAGGDLGCAMGPVIQTYYINPPYRFEAGISYKLLIDFDSGDEAYHINSFYQANFTLDPDATLTWTTTFAGMNNGNPWTISNGGKTIRFTLETSGDGMGTGVGDCGGSNNNTQRGTAETIIVNALSSITMGFSFTGNGELESTGYENISFFLEPVVP
jgi:hypothetical protein